MNNFKTWLTENKLTAALAAFLILATGALGWFVYSSWDDYASAQAEYASKSAQLSGLSHKKPFPNEENLAKVTDNLNQEQSDLEKLNKTLESYRVPSFNNLDKVKPQDLPQKFQDALRTEVTRIKSLATSSGTTLPPGFYLGLEEYENSLPQPEETLSLAKQLTVLSWMAETLTTQKGMILTEFTRIAAKQVPKKEASGSPKPPASSATESISLPYQSAGTIRVSFRSNQGSFRDIVNSLSSSPYFLLIEGIQLQNTSMEPPRRDAAVQGADPTLAGTNGLQRLPIIVGRELLNISLKIRVLEFQNTGSSAISSPATKPKSN